MDSISQVVLGAASCHAVTGKQLGRKALLLGAILGTAPDLDVFIHYADQLKAFTYHRSFSHSLFVLTLISPLVTWLIWQWKAVRVVRFTHLLFACWLSLITHPLLDSFTVYGTQLFWPLPNTPTSWSSIFIIDPLYTLPLIITGLWALYRPKQAWLSYIGLTLSSLYLAWGVWAKTLIESHTIQALKNQNIEYQTIKSIPTPFNSLLWRVVVMDKDHYFESYVSIFDGNKPLIFMPYLHNKHWLDPIKERESVQRLDWFTNGMYKVSRYQDQLVISDIRMGFEGSYIFNYSVANLAQLQQPFTPQFIQGVYNLDARPWMLKRIWKPLKPFQTLPSEYSFVLPSTTQSTDE